TVAHTSRGACEVKAEHLLVEIGYRYSELAGIVKVSDIAPDASASLAFVAERQTRLDGDILELSIAKIAIEFVWLRVVSHNQVGPAIVVIIEHGDAESLRAAVEHDARCSDVVEGTVATIVKQPA